MTEVCFNTRLPVDDAQLAEMRAVLRRELAVPLERLGGEPVRPANAYAIAFGEAPHRSIAARVRALYSPRSRIHRRGAERGSVYVFVDRRDRPTTLVKIGSTTSVKRRMTQWRAALGVAADDRTTLELLFAYETRHVRLAEAVVHALLACQWQQNRVNSSTQRRAVEYFDVADRVALRTLVECVARHVDWSLSAATVRGARV